MKNVELVPTDDTGVRIIIEQRPRHVAILLAALVGDDSLSALNSLCVRIASVVFRSASRGLSKEIHIVKMNVEPLLYRQRRLAGKRTASQHLRAAK